ncbi:hypothetical protein PWJ82_03140 [Actinotignum schaalii]|uniref:hypothetical protein n=1 Tax=Actinotignum schaalii TaxID=59505 RepID=UPI00237E28ED|nr:hypothetical protein [Actinotignum schaalii]MDE1654229.1 hypothetical protein [Actinotignum schaalii]
MDALRVNLASVSGALAARDRSSAFRGGSGRGPVGWIGTTTALAACALLWLAPRLYQRRPLG